MEERIKKFLSVSYGSGSGSGYGSGYGSGSGSGYGSGSGSGDGSGDGYGYSSGYSYGYGYGYGYGDGDGIKSLNGKPVYIIDNMPTIIETVRGNIAKGFIVQSDLTLTPCYIVKENDEFAHGDTPHDAFMSLQEKLYDNSTDEERIAKFNEHFADRSRKYPAKELFVWHHVLTGSCRTGRRAFCKDRGIDVDNDEFSVDEFIEITKNAYGGNVIRLLKQKLEAQRS